jgi:hypothetical protein
VAWFELALIPLGMVAVPFAFAAFDIDVEIEVGIALSLLIAFGLVPVWLAAQIPPGNGQHWQRMKRSQAARGMVFGAAFLFVAAVVVLLSSLLGLFTALLLLAVSLLAFSLARASQDDAQS